MRANKWCASESVKQTDIKGEYLQVCHRWVTTNQKCVTHRTWTGRSTTANDESSRTIGNHQRKAMFCFLFIDIKVPKLRLVGRIAGFLFFFFMWWASVFRIVIALNEIWLFYFTRFCLVKWNSPVFTSLLLFSNNVFICIQCLQSIIWRHRRAVVCRSRRHWCKSPSLSR